MLLGKSSVNDIPIIIIIILIIIIIIIIIIPNIFLAHTPAGAQSDLNAAAAAPSQTEVTDLNCSDHR